ncbi:SusC/RagA family TonB-linked outer membrane protein [Joostella sp.]|uniref:SusC/RagA family TonB-linked outer membrane protein n=1 Tax=Joostella sp. TaxID=2231138 RepID=UPI003A8EE2ED
MKEKLLVYLFLLYAVCVNAQNATYTVTGTITDAKTGVSLPGVSVVLKGTRIGVDSDFDGKFSIQVKDQNSVLVVSLLGFETKSVPVGQNKTLDIGLVEDVTMLDDVVLIGYEKVHKRDVTSSISSINSEAIESIPVLNVSGLIATQASGIQNVNLSGAPGGRGALVIRGNTSVGSDIDADLAFSTPLYVIDGVQTSLDDLAGYGVSNIDFLASLNPDDIKSIDILKDASAAAIYGSRGANGVIIIETKSGGNLAKPEFSFSTSLGLQPKPDLVGMYVGASERREKIDLVERWWQPNELQSDRLPIMLTDSINPSFNNNVNYQDLFYKTGVAQKYNFSVRGGNKEMNYRVSLGYDNREGVVAGTGLDRVTVSTNLSLGTGKRFSDRIITRLTYTDQQTGQGNPSHGRFNLNSTLPTSPANLQSSLFTLTEDRIQSLRGELDDKLNTDETILASISNFAEFELIKGLKLNSQLSFVYDSNKKNFYEPSTIRQDGDGFASAADYTRKNVTAETYLSLFKDINDNHVITGVLGNRVDYNKYESMRLSAVGFGSDAVQVINNRYTQDQVAGATDLSENSLVSFFGRMSYKFKDRYMLAANYSIDGSSRFGEDVRWAKFPSLSVGWIMSDEPFFKPIKEVVDYLKFKASWGVNGKQFRENYLRYGAYNLGYGGVANHNTSLMDVSSYGGVTGVIPNYNSIANDALSWEETKQWDLGFELEMFNRRLSWTFDAYHKNTEKLFFNVDFPAYSGYNSAATNIAGVINYGWESMVRYHVFPRNNDLKLELMLGFSKNENYVSKLPNGNRDFIGGTSSNNRYGYVIGQPLNLYFMFNNEYILDDISDLPVNPYTGDPLSGKGAWADFRPGIPIWKDYNGDYFLDDQNDQQLIRDISPIPDVQGSFNINMQYKKWYFQAYSQFSFGSEIYNSVLQSYMDAYDRGGDRWAIRGLADLNDLSFWQQPGDGAAGARFPAFYPSTNSIRPFYSFKPRQTLWIEDGDYWKITNASVGYTFDGKESFMKKIGLSRLRFFVNVLNPWQWQKSKTVVDASMVNAKGYTYGNGYPAAKTISLGIDTKF